MSIFLRVLVQCTWFNARLKAYHQAFRTHYQRDSYDIFSWLYTFMIRGCFLYSGTVYIGWKTMEISKSIKVLKIFLASFLFIFSYWCVGRLWFFYWRNDWNQEYISDTRTSSWSVQKSFQRHLKTTNKFQLKQRNLARMF